MKQYHICAHTTATAAVKTEVRERTFRTISPNFLTFCFWPVQVQGSHDTGKTEPQSGDDQRIWVQAIRNAVFVYLGPKQARVERNSGRV